MNKEFEYEDELIDYNMHFDFTIEDETKRFLLLDTFGVDDKDYAAFLNEETDEVYILLMEMDEEEVVFMSIDDENEYEEVLSIYSELLDEYDENI